ncbi:MAG: hypothetical protein C5B49_11815 [Bdellovibrio sp.]|nr:MAG: hypothetical protein C5B49_11815 [Bdellovibrio sp.]
MVEMKLDFGWFKPAFWARNGLDERLEMRTSVGGSWENLGGSKSRWRKVASRSGWTQGRCQRQVQVQVQTQARKCNDCRNGKVDGAGFCRPNRAFVFSCNLSSLTP